MVAVPAKGRSRCCLSSCLVLVLALICLPRSSALKLYGNWCGPDYPVTGMTPPAVDVVDEVCRSHDHCYDAADKTNDPVAGRYACDAEHWRLFEKAAQEVSGLDGRLFAGFASMYFKNSRSFELHRLRSEYAANLQKSFGDFVRTNKRHLGL